MKMSYVSIVFNVHLLEMNELKHITQPKNHFRLLSFYSVMELLQKDILKPPVLCYTSSVAIRFLLIYNLFTNW